jgi:hypothetical protein
MTLADLLRFAQRLDPAERRALAEELWLSLDEEDADPEVARLVERRVAHIRHHPEESLSVEQFEVLVDQRLGPISA